MHLQALVFDVDGTLAETERDGHLPACNEAFAALGYPIRWSWTDFVGMLDIPGTARRMRRALEGLTPALPPAELEMAARRLGELKRQVYLEKYVHNLPLRPGIARLIESALSRGVQLAIVSTSDETPIHALLRHRLPDAADRFKPVLGKESGQKTAPDSPLYHRCLSELDVAAQATLVIEDSDIGLRAALTAGLPCAVFYNDYTFGQDFSRAALVARSLEFFDLDQLAALCQPIDSRGP